MMSAAAPDLGAASDGDGDRNLIIGRGLFVRIGFAGDAGGERPPGAGLPRRHRRRRAFDAHQRRR